MTEAHESTNERAADRYLVISSDCHAGASIPMYGEYLGDCLGAVRGERLREVRGDAVALEQWDERAFVVLRTRGPAWDDSKPLEGQSDWAGHAAFMDDLFEKRFAALVGPLEGTRDALIVVRASSVEEVVERLASDPWTASGHLVTKQISPWQIRLGTLA